ncbi:MAG: 1-acyl-sn-glycerol-3-phosphate acyltransferase [Nitrospina sp.]|nr:MAG: 1-acyl-sn-glycerol-3-phosphate acyltransferase [Nitrospina sp.]
MGIFRMIYRFIGVSSVVVFTVIVYAIVRVLLFASPNLSKSTILSVARQGSRICCFILNIHITMLGKPVNGSAPLIVSNHVGSLDILVLAASFKTFFVSMADVKGWPVIGWLSTLGGTIFVDRAKRHQVPHMIAAVSDLLKQGFSVALFPEGGATIGEIVGPFKSTPFEAAIRAAKPVLPILVQYHDASSPSVACWANVNFKDHCLRIMKHPRLDVSIHVLPEITEPDRRALAEHSHRLLHETHQSTLATIE